MEEEIIGKGKAEDKDDKRMEKIKDKEREAKGKIAHWGRVNELQRKLTHKSTYKQRLTDNIRKGEAIGGCRRRKHIVKE